MRTTPRNGLAKRVCISRRLPASTAAAELELCRSRFNELYSDYLAAGPSRDQSWQPHSSGGNHAQDWPVDVKAFLRTRLNSRPPPWGTIPHAGFRA